MSAPDWTTVESLKGTQLGALVVDLGELEKEKDDLELRIKLVREMIAEQAVTLPHPVKVLTWTVRWVPASEPGEKWTRKSLVVAGVDPEKIEAAREETAPKKAHLRIDPDKTLPLQAPAPDTPSI